MDVLHANFFFNNLTNYLYFIIKIVFNLNTSMRLYELHASIV